MILLSLTIISCGNSERDKAPESVAEIEKEIVEIDMDSVSSVKQGETFTIKKANGEREFKLLVNRAHEAIAGIISISAYVEDRETGLAALVLRDGKLAGNIELYKEKLRFRVGYDTTTNQHYIQEQEFVNNELPGSEPLDPSSEQE